MKSLNTFLNLLESLEINPNQKAAIKKAFNTCFETSDESIDDIIKRKTYEKSQGNWIPASGGQEKPFTIKGFRLLYCYQPSSGKHGYLNLDTDIILSDEEAAQILNR